MHEHCPKTDTDDWNHKIFHLNLGSYKGGGGVNNKVLTWPLSQPLLKPQPPFSVNIKLKVNQQKLLHFSMEKDPCETYITWPNGICFWLENLKILLKTYKHCMELVEEMHQ